MGLCLFVFGPPEGDDDPTEIAECDIGHYSDFNYFREAVSRHLDADRFPVLLEHSDCEGEWTLFELPTLERELKEIADAFQALPPEEPESAFEHTAEYRENAKSLYDSFHNPSGENLLKAMLQLCAVAMTHRLPITFM